MTPTSSDKASNERADRSQLMLAYLCIATEKAASLETKVEVLDRFRLADTDIATVCGVKIQSVRNARQVLRKHGPKGKKAK
jgi:hypothetical protein